MASATGQRTQVKDGFRKGGHEQDFKPAKVITEKVPTAAYKYIPQGGEPKKVYRNAEGEVICAPRNFTTMRLKLGKTGRGTTFAGMIPHIPEDPNLRDNIKKAEM